MWLAYRWVQEDCPAMRPQRAAHWLAMMTGGTSAKLPTQPEPTPAETERQRYAMTTAAQTEELARADLEHLIHPLFHPAAHEGAVIFERGEGVWLWDTNGKRYLDGLSCLWNVNI